jgi:hypothetical protein
MSPALRSSRSVSSPPAASRVRARFTSAR